jgi:DNA repair protein RadC
VKLRFLKVRESSGEVVNSPKTVSKVMSEEAQADRECFWVLHLNTSNRVIEKELVAIGSVDSCQVHAREVFKKVIVNGAYGIITVHNHPGGTAKPSREDRELWKYLDGAGELLGIEVMDHMIITPADGFYSRKMAAG